MKRLALLLGFAIAGCSDSHTLAIGSPCPPDQPTSSACGPFPTYFCASDHPNGYCKKICHADGECPTGSVCVGPAGQVGECHKTCTQATAQADCRVSEGYVCKSGPANLASHDFCDGPDQIPDGGTD